MSEFEVIEDEYDTGNLNFYNITITDMEFDDSAELFTFEFLFDHNAVNFNFENIFISNVYFYGNIKVLFNIET